MVKKDSAKFVIQKMQPVMPGLVITFIRYRFMKTPLPKTILEVIAGGGVVFILGIYLGNAAS